ncbi:Serine phosphatase RsbU, regulator of sigma subunit [Georgenia satyanarayanai]|uniref:Serine phosphatase RsbU, regulator of sigma subunit n=1 Tax=Georgenia satyanarayanai TaxID=860221 RepID=A0A2Y8ZVX4_9MICO|nr:PP2C family protein-serine/threonine phosphatase [Georgenia satyanarayanai]PYG01671.1 serine phosphatase RsbU (regulator of sigma subunit) [Georgenia satyanarayanai]SSA36471.1 Serine phosphatase RsbU, regulator of sigma subunit [Georgenia satyanarayanai]
MAVITPGRQRELSRHAQVSARLGTDELWKRYFAVGGTAGALELDAYLNGALDLPPEQRDRVALAINEHIDALAGKVRAPYSRPLRSAGDQDAALAALRELLRGTHLAPPDRIPAALDAAAAHLGLTAVIYLADYANEVLVPFPGRHGTDRAPMTIDATLAGRAYRHLRPQTTVSDGQPRIWMPILDGVERLGVLDVMVEDSLDLHDPVLHRQVWLVSHYLGHLLTALEVFGDSIDAVRRTHPRSIEAELVWSLLPPLTAGTDKVLLSGRLEPSHDVGGDVFDYSLSPTRAHFAVVDATGHDLRAGMAAAVSLAAYRNARRQGHGLFAQAEAVHGTLAEHFGGQYVFATGVFGELDLDSGRLRYFVPGHPAPLLLRRGKVVKTLDQGRRSLLGLDVSSAALGEERLEAGDIVVIYTDGITEARDARRQFFGTARLIDTIERAAGDATPLPEIARTVLQDLLRHQKGVLQDDATLVLVQWTTEAQADLDPTLLQG